MLLIHPAVAGENDHRRAENRYNCGNSWISGISGIENYGKRDEQRPPRGESPPHCCRDGETRRDGNQRTD